MSDAARSEQALAIVLSMLAILAVLPPGMASMVGTATAASGPTADAGSDQTIYEGSWATLDASGSTDDVAITTYKWDFDGDAQIDLTTTNATVNHTYREVGTHTATVTVEDGDGNTDTDSVTITVKEAMPKYHGGPRNLGHYPNQTGPTTKPNEVWNVSDGTPHVMQSIIVNGTLYTAFHDGGKLYALDPETGAEEWSATPGGSSGSTWSTPAYANGVLYIGTNDYKLHAIDAETGDELWNYSTQTNVRSAPAVVDGVVYFGSNDGNMTAVNATTGEELWHHTLYQPVRVESNPAVVDGVVYFGSHGDNVTALNATTGNQIWQFPTDGDPVGSDPTVVNDTVYVGSGYAGSGSATGTHEVYALNATDGTERWNHTLTGQVDSGPAYADGTLYAASRGGDLTALNASDGSVEWNVTGSDFRGAPVVVNGVVYIMDYGDGSIHAFNATDGTELWADGSPSGTHYSTPLVWNNYVYYGAGSTFRALKPPAPSISSVSATNPSGQDLSISFDSSEQLDTISVSLSGPSSTTFTKSDFSESGSGPYTYTLSSAYDTGADGTYTVSVDTAENSQGQDGGSGQSDSVTIDTTAPTADAGSNQSISLSGSLSVDGSGSSDNLGISSYDWDFGDGSSNATGATASHTYSNTGEYTVTLTVTDGSGNTDSDTLTVTVSDDTAPTASVGSDETTDEDVSVSFDGSSSTDNVGIDSYSWEFGDGGTATGATPSYTYADPGTYTVNLTVADSAGNTDTANLTVTVNDTTAPTAEAGPNQTVDEDVSTSFDATGSTDNGDLTYSWDFGDGNSATGATPSHTYADPGTYTVTLTATDGGGNTDTDTLTVTVNDTTAPTAEASPNQTVDEDVSTSFDGTSSTDNGAIASYSWDFGDGNTATGSTPSHTYADPGTYTVTLSVTDDEGNTGTDTLTVTVNDTTPPTAEAGPNQTVDEDASTSFDATGSTDNGDLTYSWDFGDTNTATGSTPSHTYADPGTYTVTLTATDGGGNTDTDTLTVTVNDATPPSADAGSNQTVDEDVSTSFDGTSSTDNGAIASYSWDFGDGNSATGSTPSHIYADPGNYTVTLSVTDDKGNTGTDTLTVTVNDTTAPTAEAGPDLTTDNDTSVSFDATGSTDNGDLGYEWDFGDGSSNATGATPSHTYTAVGTYTVTVTATDDGDNADSDTLTVTVEDATPPTVETNGNKTVDEDTLVSFDASSSTDNVGITSYSWDFGDGNSATGATPSHTYDDPGTYTATVTAEDAAGNTNNSTVTVTVNDTTAPTAEAGPNQSVKVNTNVSFDATNSTDNGAIASYSWEFGDDATGSGATPNHTYTSSGTYTVNLTVTDAAGHTATDSLTVTVTNPSSGWQSPSFRPDEPSENQSDDRNDERTKVAVNATDDANASESASDEAVSATVENADTNSTVVIDFTSATNQSGQNETSENETNENETSRNETSENGTDDGTTSTPTDDLKNVSVTGMEMNVTRGGNFSLNVTTRSRTLNGSGNDASDDETANGTDSDETANDSDDSDETDDSDGTGDADGSSSQQTDDYRRAGSLSKDDREFANETGARPAGQVIVTHTISDRDIENVTFTFEVRKEYLNAIGGDPESVKLFRNETVRWRTLETKRIGETDTHYVFRAISPGLSEFTIGVSSPLFEVRAPDLDATQARPGERVNASAVVANVGTADGTYNVTLNVDGKPVTTKSVFVPAETNRTVTLPVTFDATGTYAVAVESKSAGAVQVAARETTTTESTTTESAIRDSTATDSETATVADPAQTDSTGQLLFAVVVVLVVVALLWRRQREDT